jgi:rhomboid protease GluP
LAREFVLQKGFEIGSVSDVKGLAAASNIVLTRSDGRSFTILCLIDQERDPRASFNLDVNEVLRIGESCQKPIDEISRAPTPVFIRIMEIGYASTEPQERRLRALHQSSRKAKVSISTMIVDTTLEEVWASDRTWLAKGAYQGFVEKLLNSRRSEKENLIAHEVVTGEPLPPTLTYYILAALLAVFTAEIAFGIGRWTDLFQPTVTTLVAFGGLMPNLVLQYGQWYRLLSGPLLHVDAAHLVLSAICLFLAGQAFENLIGPAWFGVICLVGALGGSFMALSWDCLQP